MLKAAGEVLGGFDKLRRLGSEAILRAATISRNPTRHHAGRQ